MSASDPSAPGLPLAGGGGASLPTTPGLALLDAGAASRVVVLNALGEGDTESYDTVGNTALTEILGGETEGDFVVADGEGEVQLASAAPATVREILAVQDGPRVLPFFGYATSSTAVAAVEGFAAFTPADYAITGRTTTLTLDAVGSVTSGSQTGTLEVLDFAGTTVASIDWTETTPTRKTDTITLPGSAEIYCARISCAGVVDPLTDYTLIGAAVLRITWS